MQQVLSVLIAALAFVFSSKTHTAELNQQIADRDKIIDDLHTSLTADDADKASLAKAADDAKAAQAAAEKSLADLNASIAESQAKAAELAQSITDNPEIPLSVDAATGTVTNS